MVFDCVMSRRRQYERVVLPLVDQFRLTPNAISLRALAEKAPAYMGRIARTRSCGATPR